MFTIVIKCQVKIPDEIRYLSDHEKCTGNFYTLDFGRRMPLAQIEYTVKRRNLVSDVLGRFHTSARMARYAFSKKELTRTVLFFTSWARRIRPRVSGSWSGNKEIDMLERGEQTTKATSHRIRKKSVAIR